MSGPTSFLPPTGNPGDTGSSTGAAAPSPFDLVADPLVANSLVDALTSAVALQASLGRDVVVGLKAGSGVGYTFTQLDWPEGVHLWGNGSSDGPVLDGKVRVLTGGRRRATGVTMTNSQAGATLEVNPSAQSVVILRGVALRNTTGNSPCCDVLSSNGIVIADGLDCFNSFPSSVPSMRAGDGVISLQGNCFVSHGDFDDACVSVDDGAIFLRRVEVENPIVVGAGGFAQIEHAVQDAFQNGRSIGAIQVGAGGLVRLRNTTHYNADGGSIAVFNGPGEVQYTHFGAPEFGGMGTLFSTTETRQQEREGVLIT